MCMEIFIRELVDVYAITSILCSMSEVRLVYFAFTFILLCSKLII